MDSQRSLFKKFFGNNNNKTQETNGDNSGNRGFNPPKFQFDKKKLGIMSNSRVSEPVESTKDTNDHIAHIENIGIDESEFGDDHLDDWMNTDSTINDTMNTSMNTTISDAMNNSMNNTMNTTKIIEIPKETTTSTNNNNNTEFQNNMNTAIHKNTNDIALYNGILQKNHQKYNLSNQLEHFNEDIEVFQRNCAGKRNQMELLVLSLDEKLGKQLRVVYT